MFIEISIGIILAANMTNSVYPLFIAFITFFKK